jgi:hypothetical protein
MLVANPWSAVDAEGRPCGACRRDPVEDNPSLGYVGARLSAELVKAGSIRKIGKYEQVTEVARYDRTWIFDSNPVRVPNTKYYLDRAAVRADGTCEGSLLPGDAQTAKYLRYKTFNGTAELIEKHRQLRIAEFDAQHGPGSWQELEDERNPKEQTAETPAKTGKK